MDKTYSEAIGIAPFNWNEAINNAINFGTTKEVQKELEHKSRFWTTCACGNMCAIIPRGKDENPEANGAPLDIKLNMLGYFFYKNICDRNYIEAKKVLKKIEKRSSVLIKRELKILNSSCYGTTS